MWGWYVGTACVGAGVAWTVIEEWQRRRKLACSI